MSLHKFSTASAGYPPAHIAQQCLCDLCFSLGMAHKPRLFNQRQRRLIWLLAKGKCQSCGQPIDQSFHADHVIPYSKGGQTVINNCQALCASCNLHKGATYAPRLDAT